MGDVLLKVGLLEVGFIGGLLIWGRIGLLSYSITRINVKPLTAKEDPAFVARYFQRYVLVAVAWVVITALALGHLWHIGRTGWALFFAVLMLWRGMRRQKLRAQKASAGASVD